MPSGCGGGGSCGLCKCKVEAGGRDILPTELAHLTRKQRLEGIRVACQLKVKEDMRVRIPDEIFNIRKYSATVVSNENVATFIKELILKLEPGQALNFKSGAYVQIDIPAYHASFKEFSIPETYKGMWDRYKLWSLVARTEEPVYRAYSMANTPSEDLLRFTIRIATPPPGAGDEVPPGVGSSYAFSLKPGDKVTLSGPFGEFFITRNPARDVLHRRRGRHGAHAQPHLRPAAAGPDRPAGSPSGTARRSTKEMIYDEEFRELARRFPNFTYTVALSEPLPEDNWDGPVGFIHQVAHDLYLGRHEDPDRNRILPVRPAHDAAGGGEDAGQPGGGPGDGRLRRIRLMAS
ncbi:MAG: NADH:ubiquinone reductase (Na(+)-transporting) subunit F [Desulfobacterales bacterium]|nr:NADH:ubiquinone reductase (Na(+)-transporting) subunit F [Desulfobacterales bacterium]